MATFKIIKKKDFVSGTISGTVYTLAHQGRVFNASTLSFEDTDLVATATHLEVKTKIELVPESYTNSLGQLVVGYKLMPKFDLSIASF